MQFLRLRMLMGNYADYDGTLRPYETVVYAV